MASQRSESSCQNQSKKSKIGVTILKEIVKSIRLDPDLTTVNNQILHKFLDSFITQMKHSDVLFKSLYCTPFFTGSFYSDLRVSKPDEFDINLILKLPFKNSDFEISFNSQAPSYAKYRLKNPQEALEKYPLLMKTLFEDGHLIPEKMRKWIQSVVDKARNMNSCPAGIMILPKSSGPARTILLKKSNGQIDVDLVPVIACELELPRANFDGRISAIVGNKLKGFLVPKPYYVKKRRPFNKNKAFLVPKPFSVQPSRQMPVNRKEASYLWRSHFPEAEEKIIHDTGCVKPVIKLLKLLRDEEDWKILASYYLKTVVMWMIIENKNMKNEKDYWKEDKMDERFIDALRKLFTAVSEKKIPYLFNKKYNLIEKMNDQQAENLRNRLFSIIKKIEENRNSLWSVFHIRPQFGNSVSKEINMKSLSLTLFGI